MHQLIFWGCLLAVAITFPLVFGWIHFTSAPNDQMTYVTHLFGYPAGSFRLHTLTALLLFHGLDIAAVMVLGGIALSLWRRMRDQGAQAVQTLVMDFWPLILLFAISITGLALTVSQEWLGGSFYSFHRHPACHHCDCRAALSAVWKVLSHLPASGPTGSEALPASWRRRRRRDLRALRRTLCFRMHVDDLKRVLPQVGFNYAMAGPVANWQDLCPTCKRKSLSLAQMRLKEEAHG